MGIKKNNMTYGSEKKAKCVWSDRKHHLWFPFSFTKYSVEDGRLYINKGFLSSREDECLLYRILDLSVTRTLGQRLCGTGNIELNTKDRSNPVILLENVAHPIKVKRMLSSLIEEERKAKGIDGKDMYGASSHYDPVEGDSYGDMHMHPEPPEDVDDDSQEDRQ